MDGIGFQSKVNLLIFSLTQSNFQVEFQSFTILASRMSQKKYKNSVKLAFKHKRTENN